MQRRDTANQTNINEIVIAFHVSFNHTKLLNIKIRRKRRVLAAKASVKARLLHTKLGKMTDAARTITWSWQGMVCFPVGTPAVQPTDLLSVKNGSGGGVTLKGAAADQLDKMQQIGVFPGETTATTIYIVIQYIYIQYNSNL